MKLQIWHIQSHAESISSTLGTSIFILKCLTQSAIVLPFLYHVTCQQMLIVLFLDGNHNLHFEVPTLICQLWDLLLL